MILSPRIVKNLAAIAVSLLFLGWLFGHQAMSWAGIYEPLLALPAAVWLLVVLGLLSTYVLRGWRVAYEFRDYEKLTLLRAIQVVMWHNATLNVLPFRSGEVVFPLLLRQVADIPVVNSVTSLVYLRFQDACTVLMIGIAFWPNIDLSLRLLLALLLVAAAVLFQQWAKSTTSWQDSASSLKRKLASWREALARGNQRAGLSWLLTISNWIIKISIQAILYGYLLHLSFSIGVLSTLSTELAAFLPIQGLAGIGTFEASSAVVMRAEGVPWMEALQVAAQVHVMMLASSLLWAFVSMFALPLTQQKKVSV